MENFATVCRTCLKNSNLYPIFASEGDHERYSNAIYLCTGIQVNPNDGFPQNICTVCMHLVNNILKFRKRCKEVETQLHRLKSDIKEHKNSFVTNTKYSLEVPNTILKKEYCWNTTGIEDDLPIVNDIKTEPVDIEENGPLKVFIINNHNMLLKNDEFETKQTDIENTDTIKEEEKSYSNEEQLSLDSESDDYADKELNLTSKTSQKSQKKCKEDLSSDSVTTLTHIGKPDITFKDISNGPDVPYNIIKESVTKTTRVVCKICQKELSIRSIDTHMARSHPGADKRKVKCELCDKYVMKNKLNRHRVMAHSNSGFCCGYCKAEFNSKELLVAHVPSCVAKKKKRKASDTGRTMAECDVCHKKMQRASLKMHKAVKHAGLRPVCEHCGKSFGNKFRLNDHYRAKHGYEKFKCTYCDFRSAGIMAMRNHERRHRGEKPFVCDSCGAKFHASYLLTQHKQSHRTEKPVKCDLCPASFKTNNSLHMHKLTCHSKSVYRCTICARCYKCRYYAVKHARQAHNVTGTPPVIKLTS